MFIYEQTDQGVTCSTCRKVVPSQYGHTTDHLRNVPYDCRHCTYHAWPDYVWNYGHDHIGHLTHNNLARAGYRDYEAVRRASDEELLALVNFGVACLRRAREQTTKEV